MIRFRVYNIRNVRNRGFESALRGISQTNMDLGVFQETKVTKVMYTRESSGYMVVATEATSAHSSAGAVFYIAADHFSMEALQTYGANFFRFHLALGEMQWFIVGCYLAPDNNSTI